MTKPPLQYISEEFIVTATVSKQSQNYTLCDFPTVNALILECTKEITENQLIIDCSTNRESNVTYCTFDGNSRQECEESPTP